jgi:SAM-dependent methyltransferase
VEPPAAETSYPLSNSWAEAGARLRLVERLQDPATRRRIERLGIAPGWHCLEVGAGAGSVARWLADRVGPEGRVLATDLDLSLLGGPRAPNLDIVRHDVTTDELRPEAFDLVHIRWVLHHLPEPDRVVERLVRALRPGGRLLVEELDRFPVAASPSAPFVELAEACMRAIERRSGGSYGWARALPAKLEARGLVARGADLDVPVVIGGSERARFLQLSYLQVRHHVIADGALTEAAFDAALRLLGEPGFVGYSSATVAAWGQEGKEGDEARNELGPDPREGPSPSEGMERAETGSATSTL